MEDSNILKKYIHLHRHWCLITKKCHINNSELGCSSSQADESKHTVCFHRCASDVSLCTREASFCTEPTRCTSSPRDRGPHLWKLQSRWKRWKEFPQTSSKTSGEVKFAKLDCDQAHKQHLCWCTGLRAAQVFSEVYPNTAATRVALRPCLVKYLVRFI